MRVEQQRGPRRPGCGREGGAGPRATLFLAKPGSGETNFRPVGAANHSFSNAAIARASAPSCGDFSRTGGSGCPVQPPHHGMVPFASWLPCPASDARMCSFMICCPPLSSISGIFSSIHR